MINNLRKRNRHERFIIHVDDFIKLFGLRLEKDVTVTFEAFNGWNFENETVTIIKDAYRFTSNRGTCVLIRYGGRGRIHYGFLDENGETDLIPLYDVFQLYFLLEDIAVGSYMLN
jgi:hypothetical protein